MNTPLFLRLGIAAVALFPSGTWAQAPADADRYIYGPHMWWDSGYGMVFGPLFMILLVVITVAAVVFLSRRPGGPAPGATPPARTSLDILKDRFARGEIDKAEYEERRRILSD